MNADVTTSVSATIGGGFVGGILLGYAMKKVFKLIAVVVGFFIAGLSYLQYQHIASFDWNRIEGIAATLLGNLTNQVVSYQDATLSGMATIGIPLTGSRLSRICSWFYEGISKKLDKDNVLTRNNRTIQSSSNQVIVWKIRRE